jgi:hypothetical protein
MDILEFLIPAVYVIKLIFNLLVDAIQWIFS